MENDLNNKVKVGFVQKVADNQFETETLWCKKYGQNFQVDNIPFIAKRISLGDIVKAEYDDDDELFYFEDFVESSGNTTVRIFFYKDELIDSTREWLIHRKCNSEVLQARSIVSVNIPKEVDYFPVRAFLEKGEKEGNWVYEESCLEHQY